MVIALMLVPVIGILFPVPMRSHPPHDRMQCANNLRTLGQVIVLYMNDTHQSYAPPDWQTLVGTDHTRAMLQPSYFVCPRSNETAALGATWFSAIYNGSPNCSYVYVPGLTSEHPSPDRVVAYERGGNHDQPGGYVLFGDGRVDWLDQNELDAMIRAISQGENPLGEDSTGVTGH